MTTSDLFMGLFSS